MADISTCKILNQAYSVIHCPLVSNIAFCQCLVLIENSHYQVIAFWEVPDLKLTFRPRRRTLIMSPASLTLFSSYRSKSENEILTLLEFKSSLSVAKSWSCSDNQLNKWSMFFGNFLSFLGKLKGGIEGLDSEKM